MCDPDFSAWNKGKVNEKPDLEASNDRCCGAHFHISFKGATPKNTMRLIRLMDVNIALPLLFVDPDRQRRKLYGKAGCFRFKDYGSVGGVEYRTLSNAALQSKEIFDFCFNQIQKSIKDYNEGLDYLEFADDIQEAINQYDLNLASQLCGEFSVPIPKKVLA